MRKKILLMNLYVGLFVFICSWSLALVNVPFMKTWFYSFAWWSLILAADSVNFRLGGNSPLSKSPKRFIYFAFVSVFVWLIFELLNLRMKNWVYIGLPGNRIERWAGFFIAFATVLPALEELSLLAQKVLKLRICLFRLKVTHLTLVFCFGMGIAAFVLVLSWPRLFFPLAWLCFIFLLEPVNYLLKNSSLLSDLERGKWHRFWSWVTAGFLAGLLWELFNFWAGSHWEYSISYFGFGKIFQMPVFGYMGFLPFALEVLAFSELFAYFQRRYGNKSLPVRAGIFMLFLVYCAGSFFLMDTYTVQ